MTETTPSPQFLDLPGGQTLQIHGADPTHRLKTAWGLAEVEAGAEPPLCTLQPAQRPDAARGYQTAAGTFESDGCLIADLSMDFAAFGPGCQLEVYPDTHTDQLLPWINALLPAVGVIPMHASAFQLGGQGVAYTGFAHSGKTGLLLAAAAAGASAIGDECLWLSPGGGLQGLGLPAEVQLKYVEEFPSLRKRLPREDLRKARRYAKLASWMPGCQAGLSRKLAERAKVSVSLEALFGQVPARAQLDRLFVSAPHTEGTFTVESMNQEDAVTRMVEIQLAEHRPVLDQYAAFRYFFPGQTNPWLDRLEQHLRKALDEALVQTPCFLIRHPYPLAAQDMLHAIQASL